MAEDTSELRVSAMFRLDPESSDWDWVHILTFPVALLKKMHFARCPYKWIRYATGVVVGAQGDISTSRDSPDDVIDHDVLPSSSIDLYYHISDVERDRTFQVDPLVPQTAVTSSIVTIRRRQFRRQVRDRDGTCVLTGYRVVQAAHLLPHSKGDEYIEQYTRHRSRDSAQNDVVTEIDDVRNGVLLNPTARVTFGVKFAFLITPNFAMTSDDVNMLWLSDAKVCTAHLFVPGMEQYFGDSAVPPGSLARMPASDAANYSDWPPDVLFDAVYASAIAHNFATDELRAGLEPWKPRITSTQQASSQECQEGQDGRNKRRDEYDRVRDERAPKRVARYADSAGDHFPDLMNVPYILMSRERVEAFWRAAEEKRRETERSRLEEKVWGWAKTVGNA